MIAGELNVEVSALTEEQMRNVQDTMDFHDRDSDGVVRASDIPTKKMLDQIIRAVIDDCQANDMTKKEFKVLCFHQ